MEHTPGSYVTSDKHNVNLILITYQCLKNDSIQIGFYANNSQRPVLNEI